MTGTVTDNGVLVIMLQVANQTWPGIIDTGFNGDLELPDGLRSSVNARFIGRVSSLLASGQSTEEDVCNMVGEIWCNNSCYSCHTDTSNPHHLGEGCWHR